MFTANILKYIGKWFIRCYQIMISPMMANHCRFYPSCSQYAGIAIDRYGFWYGMILTLCRLIRCHPGCKGGYDPVPENFTKRTESCDHINIFK